MFLKTNSKKNLLIPIPILIIVLFLVFAFTGLASLWSKGIVYSSDKANWMGHPVKGEYTVTIDLSDPNSNKGKVLYSDDNHKIYVSNVQKDPSGYTIQFRSIGV